MQHHPSKLLPIVASACLAMLALAATSSSFALASNTLVKFHTSQGDILFDLYDDVAPGTVANFLQYVNANRYQDTIVHRSATYSDGTPFVVQGGGYSISQFTQDPLPDFPQHIPTFPSIDNEFHLSNVRGTMAMAKTNFGPNTATLEWFVNVSDNNGPAAYLDTQNGGFTVFGGAVAGGMSVVDAIQFLPRVKVPFPAYSAIPDSQNPFATVPKDGDDFVNLSQVEIVRTHPAFQNPIAPRDVNNDGVVDDEDTSLLTQHLLDVGSHAANASYVGTRYYYWDTNGDGQVDQLDLVPEPSAFALFGLGASLLGLVGRRRYRRREEAR